MDTAVTVVIIACITLAYNVLADQFGRRSKDFRERSAVTQRLSSIEMTLLAVQAGITKLDDVLVKIADMRGEVRVIESRVVTVEQDIRELRHGRGFVVQRSDGGLNGEYP